MVEKGRRPGNPQTRAEIVAAARAAFVADGYDRTSLRGVASRAGVDPALVHHYFPGGKPELFAESMHMGGDPRRSVEEVGGHLAAATDAVDAAGAPSTSAQRAKEGRTTRGRSTAGRSTAGPSKGAAVVLAFLRLWDADPPATSAVMATVTAEPAGGTPSFVSLVQAVSASPAAADALREFLIDRVWSQTGVDQDPAEREIRRALFTSQLNGMAFTRYVLRLEPMASATPEQIAAWIGPTLDAYAEGPLPPGPKAAGPRPKGAGPSAKASGATAQGSTPAAKPVRPRAGRPRPDPQG